METRKVFPQVLLVLFGLGVPGLTLAADDGGKIFTDVCKACHTAKKQPLDKIHLRRAEWDEAVQRMISYGAAIPKGKLSDLLDYLVKSQGPAGSVDGAKK